MPDVQTPSIGQPKDRVDGKLKVTGGAKYSAEMPVTGAAHAVLIMSTIANGRIMAMDTADAEKQSGVLLVVTPFNAPRLPQSAGGSGRQQGRVLSLMQDRDVHYNNQPIGVVVAETLEAAAEAAKSVRVQYAQMKPVTQIDAVRHHSYAPKAANQEPTDSLRGDPDSAYGAAKIRLDALYTTPIENHNPMEPHATIAVWEGDHLTVYDATQGVFGVRGTLARIFQIPQENVRCVSYFVGGGFGCKGSVWSHVPIAAMTAKQLGRPVKLVLEREQMYGMVGYRPITEQEISLSAAPDGTLTSMTHDVQTQTSTIDEFVESSAGVTRMLYACPNVGTSHRLARLNYGTPTYMRGPGESSGTFALESALDELAYTLKMDPIALRLKNYAETNPDENKPWSSKSLRACYAQGAQRFGWSKRAPEVGSMKTADGQLIGYGMATATYPARRSQASALARIMADGSGYALAGSQDIGTGTYTVMTQVAADAMGIPASRVRFELGDTDLPPTPVSGGSQTAASVGSAVLEAGQTVRKQAVALAVADPASPLSGLAAADVTVQDGRMVSTADPSKGETYAQLLARHHLPSLEANIQARPSRESDRYSGHSFGAVFAEVHVDPDFGTVRIARITGVYGVGKLLNEKTARSQFMGGIIFGIGMALLEKTMIDARTGRVMNADLAEYHVPVNADVPEIDVSVVDEVDTIINPLGIKGIGEIGITGVVAAIANAVYHATGTRVRDLPITLDKVAFA